MTGVAERAWAMVMDELRGEHPPEKLREYVEELVRWGGRMHLTARERMPEAIAAQISDSLVMLELAGDGGRVADIGTGAGFPGMVWKMARPGWKVTLFERKERIALFLERTAARLGLDGLDVRAEDVRPGAAEERFDVVTSKAAGRLGEILPLAAGLLRPGGLYVTAKGPGWEGEIAETEGFVPGGRIRLGGGRGEAVSLVMEGGKRFT